MSNPDENFMGCPTPENRERLLLLDPLPHPQAPIPGSASVFEFRPLVWLTD